MEDSEMAPDIVAEQNGRTSLCSGQLFQQCSLPRNMKRPSERLKTFTNWNVKFLDVKKLIENGFYYTNTGDVVKCAFCGVEIGFWIEGDVPEDDHKRLSPECPLVRGQAQEEPPPDPEGPEEREEARTQDVCGPYGLEIFPNSAPERAGKTPFAIGSSDLWRDFRNLGVSKISGPVSPYYATYSARLKTFDNWPIPDIQSPENLAEAGFYYTSVNDNVLCFHCGGGLKNWEPEDDPWMEHFRWFSRCGFIILRKGREYVNEVLAKEKKEPAGEAGKVCEGTRTTAQPEEREREEESAKNCVSSASEKKVQPSKSPESEGKEMELCRICRICYVREREIVFLPCGHFVSCTECAPSLSTCVVCRKPFEAIVRAYLS